MNYKAFYIIGCVDICLYELNETFTSDNMTQVDHSKGDVMTAKKIHIFAVKAQQQGSKLIDPGEGALTGKTMFVNIGREKSFASAFRPLTVAPVYGLILTRRQALLNNIERAVQLFACDGERRG